MIVAEFTSFGRKTEIRGIRDVDGTISGCGHGEAWSPGVVSLVLQVNREGFVLEVSDTGFGWNGGSAESTGLVVSSLSRRRTMTSKGRLLTEQLASSLAFPSLAWSYAV